MFGSETAEVIAGVDEKMLAEAVSPVDVGVDAESIGGIGETEQVDVARPRALEVEVPVELVFAAERLVEARLQCVLMDAG